jgi:mannosyltransferase
VDSLRAVSSEVAGVRWPAGEDTPGRQEAARRAFGEPVLWLIGLVAVGLALRIPWLRDSLYGDEVGAFYDVTGRSFGGVLHVLSGHSPELNPPLYFVVAWGSEKVFGVSALSLRLVSLVAGTAVIPLSYLLGRWTVGVRAGLTAAALAAVSPFLVFYSSEARPYALLLALTLGSTVALLRAVETGERGWWAAYAALSCAAIYTHFTAVFVLGLQFVWALVAVPRRRRALIGANVVAAVLFVPWIPNLIRTARSPGTKLYGTLQPFTAHAVRIDLGQLLLGQSEQPVSSIPGRVAVALILAALLVAAAIAIFWRGQDRARPDVAARHVLLVLLALGVPVAMGVYSSVRPSVWDSRNLISCWPAWAVLAAAILTAPRWPWRIALVAVVLAALTFGSVKDLAARYQRPDYQAAADYIARAARDHEPVVNWPDYSPGPPNELEVALDLDNQSARHPVLRLGSPPLNEVERAPPYTSLLPQTGETVARQAADLAKNGGLFLVLPGPVPIATLQALRTRHITSTPRSGILVLLAAFMGALPARFHPVAMHVYPGLHRVAVYLYRG